MKLIYYKGEIPNFGDDLNPYIFNQLLPNMFDGKDDVHFYGIGSMIHSKLVNDTNNKIFFGTGLRDVTIPYNLKNWDIRFVRGPISSNFLNHSKYITDSAYLLELMPETMKSEYKTHSLSKKYEVSLMPYFKTMDLYDWNKIQKYTGVNIIDPRSDIQHILNEVSASKKIIGVAMHGAIIADILRVPWARLRMGQLPGEHRLVSELKWNDWLLSMNLKDISIDYNNTITHNKVLKTTQFIELIYKIRNSNSYTKYQLSADEIFDSKINQLGDEINSLIKEYQLT